MLVSSQLDGVSSMLVSSGQEGVTIYIYKYIYIACQLAHDNRPGVSSITVHVREVISLSTDIHGTCSSRSMNCISSIKYAVEARQNRMET